MKKKCAVFTIVKNEDYFLSKWIKHFRKYFHTEDIYVLDHQSDDRSTQDLDVNVVTVINDLAFDHQWLLDTVESFQSELLEKYESVLFSEVDELLYCVHKPLNQMIDDFLEDDLNHLTAHGYEIKQHDEPPISITDEIIPNRNYWFYSWWYTKTLLSKVKLNWVWGFHYAKKVRDDKPWDLANMLERVHKDSKTDCDYGFYLVHLHKVDFELMCQRHEVRSKWKQKFDGGGNHNRTSDSKTLKDYFNDVQSPIERIPEDHKRQLWGI